MTITECPICQYHYVSTRQHCPTCGYVYFAWKNVKDSHTDYLVVAVGVLRAEQNLRASTPFKACDPDH
jgi:hypothetical protein